MKILFFLLTIGTINACANAPTKDRPEYILTIDDRVKESRQTYLKVINRGVENIKVYAKRNGWPELSQSSIIDKAEVVFDRKQLEKRIIEIYKAPANIKFPKGLTAGNDSKSMLLIMPESESKIYSAKFVEPGFYEKLITHELAHLLHIRILKGNEENMGPIWFFEGFAVAVSGQLESYKWSPTKQQAKLVMKDPSRGDYRQYGSLVRMLLKKTEMKTLVTKAGKKNFNQWCLEQLF